jgi:phosphoglycolate phosphatase
MQPLKLIIFDLDGTLLNTLSDLAYSANYALQESGFPTHPVEDYKLFIGNGITKLLERILPENQITESVVMQIKDSFLTYYDAHNTDYTEPYPGIPELLKVLSSNGWLLAVASNKYQKATEKLVKLFFPDITFTAVLGQREGIPAKPNPAIVYDILGITDLSPWEALYIGDSGVDMETASNSGVVSIGVTWGFRPREELVVAGAFYIADTPDDILEIINNQILPS